MEADSSQQSDLRVLMYNAMEYNRFNKIGVKPLRNFNVTRSHKSLENSRSSSRRSLPPLVITPQAPQLQPYQSVNDAQIVGLTRSNTLAPFTTLAPKSTCGYFFNWDTINKKVRTGVPPSDLVKWRSEYNAYGQKQK